MASSSPEILQISNPQTITTTTTTISSAPIATPVFHAILSNINDTVRHGFSHRRPWSELVDRSAFSKPDSLTDATHRIRKNYSYVRVNYLSCLAAVLAISLLTNPFALLALLALLFAWIFLYLFRPADSPLVILGRTFFNTETLGLLVLSNVVVVFLTSVRYVLISALMVRIGIIYAHAVFRAPKDLFLDEPESAPAFEFLSFFSGPASNASVVAARVLISTELKLSFSEKKREH